MFNTSDYIIFGDHREDKGGTRVKRLDDFVKKESTLNFTVLSKRLDYGDYQVMKKSDNQTNLFGKKEPQLLVGFEYKTDKDFYSSLMDNERVINQTIDLKNHYGKENSFLIIEGDLFDYILKNQYIKNKDLAIRRVFGTINTIDLYHANVILAKNETLAFWMMCNIIKKVCDDKNRNYKHESIADNDYEFAFSCLDRIRDIGSERAEMIMKSCNIRHFEDLRKITYNDLISIPGFKDVLATKVMKRLKKGFGG